MGIFKPDYYCDTVYQIPYDELWKKKIRGLVFDLDNTLAPYEVKHPSAKTVAFIKRLQRMGFSVCILTNNNNARLERFSKPLGLDGVANALKPFTRGLRSAMKQMGTNPRHTAIIGDQLLSDIWAGKSAKTMTVLVKPITNKDLFLVRYRRMIETWLLKRYYP